MFYTTVYMQRSRCWSKPSQQHCAAGNKTITISEQLIPTAADSQHDQHAAWSTVAKGMFVVKRKHDLNSCTESQEKFDKLN